MFSYWYLAFDVHHIEASIQEIPISSLSGIFEQELFLNPESVRCLGKQLVSFQLLKMLDFSLHSGSNSYLNN